MYNEAPWTLKVGRPKGKHSSVEPRAPQLSRPEQSQIPWTRCSGTSANSHAGLRDKMNKSSAMSELSVWKGTDRKIHVSVSQRQDEKQNLQRVDNLSGRVSENSSAAGGDVTVDGSNEWHQGRRGWEDDLWSSLVSRAKKRRKKERKQTVRKFQLESWRVKYSRRLVISAHTAIQNNQTFSCGF